jgi:putative transposase
MMYAFIAERCADVPVDAACRAMQASKSAFYAWRHAQANPTERMAADRELGDLVVKIHDASFGTYGWRRVTAELRLGLGRTVNHKRIARLTRERGLQGVTRRRRGKGGTRSSVADPRSDDRCIASSDPTDRTGCGCRTSPSTGPVRAGSTSPW